MDEEKNEVKEVGAATAAGAGAGALIGGVPGAIIGGVLGVAASLYKIFKDGN